MNDTVTLYITIFQTTDGVKTPLYCHESSQI